MSLHDANFHLVRVEVLKSNLSAIPEHLRENAKLQIFKEKNWVVQLEKLSFTKDVIEVNDKASSMFLERRKTAIERQNNEVKQRAARLNRFPSIDYGASAVSNPPLPAFDLREHGSSACLSAPAEQQQQPALKKVWKFAECDHDYEPSLVETVILDTVTYNCEKFPKDDKKERYYAKDKQKDKKECKEDERTSEKKTKSKKSPKKKVTKELKRQQKEKEKFSRNHINSKVSKSTAASSIGLPPIIQDNLNQFLKTSSSSIVEEFTSSDTNEVSIPNTYIKAVVEELEYVPETSLKQPVTGVRQFHPPYWKRLDYNTVKRLPSVDSDPDDDVLQIDIVDEENFDSCCEDGELQESPPLQSPAIYYSYIPSESVDEKGSRQSHAVGLGRNAHEAVPRNSSLIPLEPVVSNDVPYEQQAGLCYELIRTGKCAANSKPNQTCSFNHCINIEVISGYTHHLCHKKKHTWAFNLLFSLASNESPWNKYLKSEMGTQITGAVIDALLRENRADLTEYALRIMTHPKLPFTVHFVEVVINQALPDTPISRTQRYGILSNTLINLIANLVARCDGEHVKVSPSCWNKVILLFVQLKNWNHAMKAMEKVIACYPKYDPTKTPEAVCFLFETAKIQREKLVRVCFAFERFSPGILKVIGLTQRNEILERMRNFVLLDWHHIYSAASTSCMMGNSIPPKQPPRVQHQFAPRVMVNEKQLPPCSQPPIPSSAIQNIEGARKVLLPTSISPPVDPRIHRGKLRSAMPVRKIRPDLPPSAALPVPPSPISGSWVEPQQSPAPFISLQVPKPSQPLYHLHLFESESTEEVQNALANGNNVVVEPSCEVERELEVEFKKANFQAVNRLFCQYYTGNCQCKMLQNLVRLISTYPVHFHNKILTPDEVIFKIFISERQDGLEAKDLAAVMDLVLSVLRDVWQKTNASNTMK